MHGTTRTSHNTFPLTQFFCCRHTHLGDWVFGRYTLRSFGSAEGISGGSSGIAAMEYIEDDHVVILGYRAIYIKIWYRGCPEAGLVAWCVWW